MVRLDHVRRIARTMVRTRTRAVWRDNTELGARLTVALVLLLGTGVFLGAAADLGRALADGTAGAAALTPAAGGLFVVTVVMSALRTVQGVAAGDESGHLARLASHREVVVGTILYEIGFFCSVAAVPVVGLGGMVAVAAGSPAAFVAVLVAAVSIIAPATATGFALGLGLRALIRRSRFVARYKPFLVLLGTVAYFAGIVVLMRGDGSAGALGVALALFEVGPISWYAGLATLAIGPTNVAAAFGAIAFAALLSLLATAVSSWLAARVWYVSRASPDAQTGSSVGRTLPLVSARTDQIVQKVWRRIRRSPARLLYATYPLLGVGFVVVQTGSLDTIPPAAAVAVALYGAWAAGSALTLNPIGDESAVLSLTITSGTSGAEYVRARWLAGAVPGALVTGTGTALVALLAGIAPGTVLLLAVAGGGLAALAPGLACGIGTLFPRTEATTVVRGYQAVVPSTVAFVAYSLAQTVLTLPLLVVTPELTPSVTRSTGLPVGTVETVGVTAALGLLAVGSVASYRVAVARFDRYTLD